MKGISCKVRLVKSQMFIFPVFYLSVVSKVVRITMRYFINVQENCVFLFFYLLFLKLNNLALISEPKRRISAGNDTS